MSLKVERFFIVHKGIHKGLLEIIAPPPIKTGADERGYAGAIAADWRIRSWKSA